MPHPRISALGVATRERGSWQYFHDDPRATLTTAMWTPGMHRSPLYGAALAHEG